MLADSSLSRTAAGATLLDDVTCPKCRYSLRGLKVGGVCPECGTRITMGRRRSRLDDNLTDAPRSYIKILAVGCWMMATAAFGGVLLGMTSFRTGNLVVIGVTAFMAAVWWVGVVIVTQPRQTSVRPRHELRAEWRRCRRYVRFTQLGWVLAAGGWFASELAKNAAIAAAVANGTALVATPLMKTLSTTSVGVYFLAITGLVPLAFMIADLADWAGNTVLADRFRDATWGMSLGMVAGSIAAPLAAAVSRSTTSFGPTGMLLWLVSVLGGITFIGCGVLYLVCLAQLASMSAWAISNSMNAEERDQRIAEKNARHHEEMIARVERATGESEGNAAVKKSGAAPTRSQPAMATPSVATERNAPITRAASEAYMPRAERLKPYSIEPPTDPKR